MLEHKPANKQIKQHLEDASVLLPVSGRISTSFTISTVFLEIEISTTDL